MNAKVGLPHGVLCKGDTMPKQTGPQDAHRKCLTLRRALSAINVHKNIYAKQDVSG